MSRSFAVLCLLLGTFSLVGFGCKERGTASLPGRTTSQGQTNTTPPPPPVLKTGGVEKGTDPVLLQIQQALNNLAKTESYQLDVQIPSRGSQSTGRLFYAKQGGIHATLISEGVSTQLYGNNNALWVKYATTSWSAVPPGEERTSIETMLKQAFFSSETGANTLVLTGNARISKEEQDPSGCTLYTIEQTFFVPTTITERFAVCLAGGQPTSIRYIRPEGTTVIQYSRVNDPSILVKSPLE